ncbi:hypothetical protein [Jiangella muralis]|uniref:hypothetical protein n=1 Tax=Jiangella muralis TaxID=702383 RepID=UPI0012F89993|nr:hypothetical protein [Jiangella muralis]
MFFTGDWELEPGGRGFLTAFEAVGQDSGWNGWMTPVVTGSVLTRLAWRQAQLYQDAVASDEPVDMERLVFHGQDLMVSSTEPVRTPIWVRPDRDGLYHLSALAWTFVEVHPSRALHLVRAELEPWNDHVGERLVRHVERGELPYYWATRLRDRFVRTATRPVRQADAARRRPPPDRGPVGPGT